MLGASPVADAQIDGVAYAWQEKLNKDGIVIQTSSVQGYDHKAVRGEMVIKGAVSDLVALIEDLDACPDWADLCKEARLEKRVSATASYAYIYNDVPFPVSDRDVYTFIEWSKDPTTQKVTMTSTAAAGGTPETKAVRIEQAVSQWHFTPLGDGKVKVENFAHIDPNGPTPAWITNMLLVDSPYKSMRKMREIIEAGNYSGIDVPFLKTL